jgi:hypothetical protein
MYLVSEDEAMQLVGVANDRFSNEYGASGLVYFEASKEILAALQYQLDSGAKLDKSVKAKLDEAMEKLKELSDKRILAHCRRTYNSLIEGRRREVEAGKTPQQPGNMEMILTYILADEVQKTKAKRAKMMAQFNDLESTISAEI